jgi:hypothetical protein
MMRDAIFYGGGTGNVPVLKIPMHCFLVLLIKVKGDVQMPN